MRPGLDLVGPGVLRHQKRADDEDVMGLETVKQPAGRIKRRAGLTASHPRDDQLGVFATDDLGN